MMRLLFFILLPFLHVAFLGAGIDMRILLIAIFFLTIEYGVVVSIILGFFFGIFEDALIGLPIGVSSISNTSSVYMLAKFSKIIYIEGLARKIFAIGVASFVYLLVKYGIFTLLLEKAWSMSLWRSCMDVAKNVALFLLLSIFLKPSYGRI